MSSPNSTTAPAKKNLTALDFAQNDAQKQKWHQIHDKLGTLLRTDVSDLVSRLDLGLELISILVDRTPNLGPTTREYQRELFKAGGQVLTLLLRTIEKTWDVQAHELDLARWKLPGLSAAQARQRPTNKGARQWRAWLITKQLDQQHATIASAGSVDAGRSVIVMCMCEKHTMRLQKPDGSAEVIELDKIGGMERDAALRIDMAKAALWALSGFGMYLLAHFGETQVRMGGDGFGVRRWRSRLSVA